MTRLNRCLAGILLIALSACGGGGDQEDSTQSSNLQQVVERTAASTPCSKVVSAGLVSSWPVPLHEQGRYAFFFYTKSGGQAFSPTADAVIDASAGETTSCSIRAAAPSATGPAKDVSSSVASQLYIEIEDVATFYQTKPDDDLAKEKAELFMEQFQKTADPQFLTEYYHINPDFWEWIQAKTNRALRQIGDVN